MIPSGSSTADIQRLLEAKGLLPPFSSFTVAARLLGVARRIQAGEYEFAPADPLLTILFRLRRGEVARPLLRRVLVTFPEGSSIYKMGDILRKSRVSDPDRFQRLVNEGVTAELRRRHPALFQDLPGESLEGYLYPDTYWFYEKASVETVVRVMVDRFAEVVTPFWREASRETTLTLHELLTLASIIEKEAQKPAERATISSVFHNRLKAGMPLAADPTIKYALERPSKRVYYDQLKVDSPYNTYKRKGLPPGPICNPGIASINAAVYPAKTNYFFFVARKDGSHIFSRTWAEHQRARAKAR